MEKGRERRESGWKNGEQEIGEREGVTGLQFAWF